MDDEQRSATAAQLARAYETRVPIAPLVEAYAGMTMDDAYGIQARQAAAWTSAGRSIAGHKVGLTSAAMQQQLGVDEPDYGVLCADMLLPADQAIPLSRFIAPQIEPEVAFVLSRDLCGPGVTMADAAKAVQHLLPALEIIDSRIEGWRITLLDTVADNASSAAVVLGDDPVALDQVDLESVLCTLSRDGREVATGRGDAVMGTPLAALAWLANILGKRGVSLLAGQVVLSGSMTSAQPISAGDTWTAAFADVGQVTARFSSEVS